MNSDVTEFVRLPEPDPPRSPWVLTGLDRANLPLVIRGTWIFRGEPDVARLRDGLARTLALYPHLAGRMRRGRVVEPDDAGVPFTVCESPDATVADVCGAPARAGRHAPPLAMLRVRHGKQAPLGVKITRLRDGWVLGVRCAHACLDGRGFYSMVLAWSRSCSGRPFARPVVDQSLIPTIALRPRDETFRAAAEAGWRRLPWMSLLRALPALLLGRLHERAPAVRFSPAALGRLKEAASRDGGGGLSTNEALSAHLTRMCVALHRIPSGTPCGEVTVVDCRQRLASVPLEFAGNASFVVPAAGFAAGASLGEVAGRIHESLAPIVESPSRELLRQVSLALELMGQRALWLPYDVGQVHASRPTITYVNNFSKLPIYEVDFGDEGRPVRPVLAIPHDLPDPVLIWPAPPERGGVEVFFTGRAARALRRLDPADPWWQDLRQFDDPGDTPSA
jgi:hypothetical protein